MDYVLVSAAALVAAVLVLFSGFGLGTLLLPVFALFLPAEAAVATTAVVHLITNVFRAILIGRKADLGIVLAFGIPAAIFAVAGATLLTAISAIPPIATYQLGFHLFQVTLVKTVIALLIAGFAILELVPVLQSLQVDRRYLPPGGALSGFFGGLSGHQGAFRSVFLTKVGLDTEAFAASNALCAVIIDIPRLVVYGLAFLAGNFAAALEQREAGLIVAASAAALAGTLIGTWLLPKVTIDAVRRLVGVMLIGVAIGLGTGLV